MDSHKPHTHHWLIILTIAIALMAIVAFLTQRTDITQKIPGFGPSATPTPIASKTISISEPSIDGFIAQDFIVRGKAKENVKGVNVRLSDKVSGEIYGETVFTLGQSDSNGYGDFTGKISVSNPHLKSGQSVILELFQLNSSGHEIDHITLPLTFSTSGESIIK